MVYQDHLTMSRKRDVHGVFRICISILYVLIKEHKANRKHRRVLSFVNSTL